MKWAMLPICSGYIPLSHRLKAVVVRVAVNNMLRCSGKSKYTASKALCVLTKGDPHPWPNRPIGIAIQTTLPALPRASQFPRWKWEALL